MYDLIFITIYLYNQHELYRFVGIKLCFIIYYIQVIYTLFIPHIEVVRVSRCRPHWNIFFILENSGVLLHSENDFIGTSGGGMSWCS